MRNPLDPDTVVLVCGQRDFSNKEYLYRVLDDLRMFHSITRIVSGAAKGADTLAVQWAIERGIAYSEYPANWKQFGLAAGPIRNQKMLDSENPDFTVAFYECKEKSKGTRDMVKKSLKAGKTVHEYEDDARWYAIITPPSIVNVHRNVYNEEVKQYWNDYDNRE
jgi:hypothetical protein